MERGEIRGGFRQNRGGYGEIGGVLRQNRGGGLRWKERELQNLMSWWVGALWISQI